MTTINAYGFAFTINRSGHVVLPRGDGGALVLGDTRSRIFLGAVALASLIERENPEAGPRIGFLMANLSKLVSGDLSGSTMRRVFDTLHILKVEAGDTDVGQEEIGLRLVTAR